jgi:hypothetical protein
MEDRSDTSTHDREEEDDEGIVDRVKELLP